jgi:uncharacterized protein YneF (UPF0154 family)
MTTALLLMLSGLVVGQLVGRFIQRRRDKKRLIAGYAKLTAESHEVTP